MTPAERDAHLVQSLQHLETAENWGLRGNPRLQRMFGLALRERGALAAGRNSGEPAAAFLAAAEQRLRLALVLHPGWPNASVPLTDLLALRGAYGEAEQILQALLEHDPNLRPARQRLEKLQHLEKLQGHRK